MFSIYQANYIAKLAGAGVMTGLLMSGMFATVSAQTASSDVEVINITGHSENGYAIKQTVTATKTDTLLRDIPQSISIVTENQIRDQSSQGLAEALRYIPAVGFAQGEGNRETPIFRGISTTGDFFMDGVRDDVQYYRDLYNIERVEVFRGPNAMIFGRGATGGLINRVAKTPTWEAGQAASFTGGAYNNRRASVDINQPISDIFAFRVNGLYEDSDSYRDGVWLKRKGITPAVSWRATPATMGTLSYEHFEDDRIADRGISSFQGAPLSTDPSTFFGNAEESPVWSDLDAVSALIDHEFGNGLIIRNRTRWSDQEKFYQNVFAGNVNAAGTMVAISAYNNVTTRESIFNQTDLTFDLATGGIEHKLLVGAEFGEQDTVNFRTTGFFPGDLTSINVPLSNPVTSLPLTYRQGATDADNNGTSNVAAVYAQDQIELTTQFQVIAGLRYDSFKVDFTNNRTNQTFNTTDEFVSPRVGVIYKPFELMSVYANYSIAYQPRAGDQLASLTLANSALEPEKFENYELGAKWDITENIATTVAVFRLDRSNVIVLDPTDTTNTRTILSDGQRTEGFELDVTGNISDVWSITGGYAYSDARFTANTTATLRDGARVGQMPRHTFTLWNRYDFTPMWGAGIGLIHRTDRLASNELIATTADPMPNVELPGYTRVDAAVFFKLNEMWQAQINVENLFNEDYFANAHSNTNITPGSPRAFRVGLNLKF